MMLNKGQGTVSDMAPSGDQARESRLLMNQFFHLEMENQTRRNPYEK